MTKSWLIQGLIGLVAALLAALLGIGGGGGLPLPTVPTVPGSSSTTTSLPGSSSTTSSLPVGTSTTLLGSTTTLASTTTSTTWPVPTEPGDTGFTRIRVTIDNHAQWVTAALVETDIALATVVATTGGASVTSLGPVLSVSGIGQAVIDLVLGIGPDADPVLDTCKNFLGRATVTLERMTDAPAVVEVVVNDGTSPFPPSGQCENPTSTPIDRSALMGPVRWPARADPRRLVLAGYYPWYDAQDLNRNFGDLPVGPALTDDPDVVAEAVALAASSGIDGFVVEYEARPLYEDRVDHVYAAAGEQGSFDVALFLDFDIMFQRDGNVTDADLDLLLDGVAERADDPSQLEKDGEPVVFTYGSYRVAPEQWQAALDRLEASADIEPFVIDQQDRLGNQGRYEYGPPFTADPTIMSEWARDVRQQLRFEPGLRGEPTRLWVAPVMPGYDDSRLNRYPTTVVPRSGNDRYNQTWTTALATLPDWILITSWNEYFEQTHIVPGSASGTTALERTSEWSARFEAAG